MGPTESPFTSIINTVGYRINQDYTTYPNRLNYHVIGTSLQEQAPSRMNYGSHQFHMLRTSRKDSNTFMEENYSIFQKKSFKFSLHGL